MKWIYLPLNLFCISLTFAQGVPTLVQLSDTQQQFRSALTAKVAALEKENSAVAVGQDGWLFLSSTLRFLSLGKFWGAEAPAVSRAHNSQWADPIPAIVDFQRQLQGFGIRLLLVPVPPKALIYPEGVAPNVDLRGADGGPILHRFYDELRANGVDVLDLTGLFLQHCRDERGPMFCKTDSHWSGVGCVLAADAVAEKIRSGVTPNESSVNLVANWKDVLIDGDLQQLLDRTHAQSAREKIPLRQVSNKSTGSPITPDVNSPVLLLGDSHVLVYHDFLAERAGLLDQLAYDLGCVPDVIGTRGSGATPVRISLRRRSLSDASYLAKKKVVIWCFSAGEFTESEQGWEPVPLAK